MKKIILLTTSIIFISSAAYGLRVPMWRLIHEQNGVKHYYDVGTLLNNKNSWSFGYKLTTENVYITSTTHCKESENGVWTRSTNVRHCSEEVCVKQKDSDWTEMDRTKIGYAVCIFVLPYCDEKKDSKNKDGFCRNREDE